MKKLFLAAFVSLSFAIAAQAQNGNLTGVVFGENRETLVGAIVTIPAFNEAAITNSDGRYNFAELRPGTYSVTVTYIGYTTLHKDVTIEARRTATVDFTLTAGMIESVVVTGTMGNTLRALNQQMTSDRIVNVISSEQIGSFPDENIGDALKRIPGVYVQYDEGEASLVSIRGTDPSKSSFMINGAAIPSSMVEANGDAFSSMNRAFGIQGIPADMVQSIEVNKTITPDLDGDAIGGSVNLVTRKAPYERRLSLQLEGGLNSLVNGPAVNGRFSYGERFFDNKLGVMLSASVYDQKLGSNKHSSSRWDEETIGGEDYFLPRNLTVEQTMMERLRQSYTLSLDWQINPRHNISLTGMYNDYKDWRSRYTLVVDDLNNRGLWKKAPGIKTVGDFFEETGDAGDAWDAWEDYLDEIDADGDGLVDATGADVFDFDPQHPTYYPELERHVYSGGNKKGGELTHSKIINAALAGDHRFGILKVDWSAALVRTTTDKPEMRDLELQTNGPEDAGSEALSREVVMDYTDPRFVNFDKGFEIGDVQAAIAGHSGNDDVDGDGNYYINQWYLDGFKGRDVRSSATQWTTHIDFELPIVQGRFGNTIKFGGKARLLDKESSNTRAVKWKPALDPAFGLQDPQDDEVARLWNQMWSSFGDNMIDVSKKFNNSRYTVGNMVDAKWVGRQNVDGTTTNSATADWVVTEREGDAVRESYKASEKIYAAYAMTTQDFGKRLSMIAGLRMEHTVLTYNGSETNAPLPANPLDATVKYTSWLPGVHFRYTPVDQMVLRAAYSKTISRQSWDDIKPSMSISVDDAEDAEYEIGNPNLKPMYSNNFDLIAEWYPSSIGVISAGVYYKKISNFKTVREFQTPWSQIRPSMPSPDDPRLQELVEQGVMTAADLEDYQDGYNDLEELYEEEGEVMITTIQPQNGGQASLIGLELSFQRRLDFLPGFLRNLSLYANYTHNWMGKNNDAATLTGTAKDALNVSLAYETKRVSARLSYNYTSPFLMNTTSDVMQNFYCDAVNYLNLNIDYHIIPNKLIVNASASNLLNETTRYYQWRKDYTRSDLATGIRFQVGMIWNIF